MKKYAMVSERVEAEQWDPDDAKQAKRLGIICPPGAKIGHLPSVTRGSAVVNPGDWIVKDESGNITIWPDGRFRMKFKAVD